MIDHSPTEDELFAEVRRMVTKAAAMVDGQVPGVGTPEWWAAEPAARLAGLLVCAEAYLVTDPEGRAVAELKAMAEDLSAAYDWTAVSHRPSHATLTARRAEPGPIPGPVDPEAERRWVETGSSELPARPSTTTPRRAAA